MATPVETTSHVAFGLFEADPRTGELWKAGRKIKLQSQPFKVLCILIERPGEVVTREEIQLRLWGKHTVVDFDHSLGTAVNKIREALGDTAENPRFVETLARRGYRFIAPVTTLTEKTGVSGPATISETITPAPPPASLILSGDNGKEWSGADVSPTVEAPALEPETIVAADDPKAKLRTRAGIALLSIVTVVAVLAALLGYFSASERPAPLLRIEQLTRNGRIAPGMPAMESLPAFATDGFRIFVPEIEDGRSILTQVDVHTGVGQILPIPAEIPSPSLGDLSPDGTNLLMRSHLSPESERPLWIVPTSGGSALRLRNVVGHDATWMPDGKNVLYAAGNRLLISRLQDGAQTPFAELPGRAFWLRWSPDGKLLRFTIMDPIGHTLELWEAGSDGKNIRPILKGWSQPSSECCGTWTGDGKYFVFQSSQGGNSDLWRLEGKHDSRPVRVTNGPLNFAAPVSSRSGERIFFLGLEAQSTLQVFDSSSQHFVPGPVFLANAARVEYTRDGHEVTWTDDQGRQWRAHADGSEKIQITPNSMQVFFGRWSPDGKQMALMARETGKAWQIYLVSPDGGEPERPLPQSRNEGDPSWSPDGRQLVFGRISDVMGKEEGPRGLEVFDLRTHAVTAVPGSDGLFSPRWSPDGRYIAAISLDQRRLLLYDTVSHDWKTIAETTAADPVWAADSRSIYFHAALAETQPIYRVSVQDGRLEQISTLASFVGGSTADYFFCGLSPANVPIVRSRTGTGNLYSIDLQGH